MSFEIFAFLFFEIRNYYDKQVEFSKTEFQFTAAG